MGFLAKVLAANLGLAAAGCIGNGQNDTDIQNALNQGGTGAVIELCPNAVIPIYNTIAFSADDQIIQTQGLPTDSSRALLQITVQPGLGTPWAIIDMCTPSPYGPQDNYWQNLGLRNIVLDGNRQVQGNPGAPGGPIGFDAIVVMGAGGGGQFVDQVELRNNRGSNCIYVQPPLYDGEGSSANDNMSMTNSVFRNCTTGISLDGNGTLIANNEFYLGSGIGIEVVYLGVNTNITNNTFSATISPNLALAGITLGASLEKQFWNRVNGTSITNNHFSASQYMSAGILLGSNLETFDSKARLYGPLDVTGNTFSGKISFPVAIHNYYGPINITQNSISDLTHPVKAFTDGSTCPSALEGLAAGDHRLVFSRISHDVMLQSDFYNASKTILGSFFCFGPNVGPSNQTFTPGLLGTGSGTPIAALRGGIDVNFQPDGNLVVYDNHAYHPPGVPWSAGSVVPGGDCNGLCELDFTSDGNLAIMYNGTEQWQSNSSGLGGTALVALNRSPWLIITTSNGSTIWSTSSNSSSFS